MLTVVIFFLLSFFILEIENSFAISVGNKTYKISCAGMLLFLVLFVNTTNNPDYKAYEMAYLYGVGPFQEAFGFEYLANLFTKMGILSYQTFLFILGLLINFMVYLWGKKIDNIQYFIFFYSIFIMYYDVIQVRNAISTFCMISALLLVLFGKHGAINVLLLTLLVAVALSFHPITILQVLLIFYVVVAKPKKNYEINLKEILMFLVCTIIFFTLGKRVVSYLGYQIPYLWKVSLYMTTYMDWKSFIIWLSSSIIMLFVIYNYGIKYLLSSQCTAVTDDFKCRLNILFRLVLFSVVLSPFTLYMDEIVRIYRFFFVIMFLIYAMIKNKLKNKDSRFICVSITAVNILFIIVWMVRGINFDVYWG